jgi:hypothetical protein
MVICSIILRTEVGVGKCGRDGQSWMKHSTRKARRVDAVGKSVRKYQRKAAQGRFINSIGKAWGY